MEEGEVAANDEVRKNWWCRGKKLELPMLRKKPRVNAGVVDEGERKEVQVLAAAVTIGEGELLVVPMIGEKYSHPVSLYFFFPFVFLSHLLSPSLLLKHRKYL